MGWRKETSEVIALGRVLYYKHTGELRYASAAQPLPLVKAVKVGQVAVQRTCKSTGERLNACENLELKEGSSNKGASELEPLKMMISMRCRLEM